jgi:hypothetical protein
MLYVIKGAQKNDFRRKRRRQEDQRRRKTRSDLDRVSVSHLEIRRIEMDIILVEDEKAVQNCWW